MIKKKVIETRRKKVEVHINSMLLTMPVSYPNLLYNVDAGNRQIKVRSLWFVVQKSLIFEEPWVSHSISYRTLTHRTCISPYKIQLKKGYIHMYIIDELIPLKGSSSGPDVLKGFSYSYANPYSENVLYWVRL